MQIKAASFVKEAFAIDSLPCRVCDFSELLLGICLGNPPGVLRVSGWPGPPGHFLVVI